jgi:ubiquinone biosynthesis protein
MPLTFLSLRRTYKSVNRIRQIVNVFLKYGFGKVIDQIHLGRFIPFRTRLRAFGQWPPVKSPAAPEQLRMAFAELGPSFIKLAQILSSRPDLITTRYADEFKKLQDRVPPFPAEEAIAIIEGETGRKLEEIFAQFDRTPIAAASIAQVFRGRLIDGSDIIVKVQRPHISEQIETDIGILMYAANLLEKYVPESSFFNPTGIVEEFSRTVRKELDFIEEARNCNRFRKNFEHTPDIYIPRIFEEHSTDKVIIMERIEGVRIDDINEITCRARQETSCKSGSQRLLQADSEDGFFHADPHPGNILAMPSGQIGFIDFGIVGRVSPELRETMANTFLALIRKDFDNLIDQYIELGLIPEHVDLEAFRKEFKADLSDFLEPLYGMTIGQINFNFADYIDTVTHIAIKHKMKIPSDLLLVNKAMLVLENLGSELDPEFDFIAAAEPYASKLVRERLSPGKLFEKTRKNVMDVSDFVMLFPKQMKQIIQKTLRDDIGIKMTHVGLEKFIKDMDRSSNRIAFSMIISAILLSSAIMHATGAGPSIFGMSLLGITAFGIAFVLGVWLVISIIRSGRL